MKNDNASLENILDFMDRSDFDEPTGAIEEDPIEDNSTEGDDKNDPSEDEDPIEDDNFDDEDPIQEDDDESDIDDDQEDDLDDEENDPEPEPKSKKSKGEDEGLTQYYKVFSDLGILNTDEDYEFDGSVDSLEKALEQTRKNNLKSAAESLMGSFPEEFKPLLAHVLNGGTSLKEFVSTYTQEEDVTKLDVDSKENQKKILREYYRNTTKYDDQKIERFIDRLEANGDLLDEAVDSLQELKTIYAQKRETLNARQQKEEQERQEALKQYRESVSKAVTSSESIASARKGRVQAFLFNPVTKGDSTDTDFNRALVQISSNPQHLVQLADILLDYSPDRGINLERLNRRKKSEAVSEIRKKLESITDIQNKMRGSQKPSNTNFD